MLCAVFYSFINPGTYTVELITQSSGGCSSSATRTITVETPVSPGFVVNRLCPTSLEPMLYQFADTSTVADGDQIVQWLWTINGENFTEDSITYAFAEPGIYDVSLTTFASSGCNATVSQSLEVLPRPDVRFKLATGCLGEPVNFNNETQLNGWSLDRYTWEVTGLGTIFESSPTVVFSETGEHLVSLTLETAEGCSFTFDSTITILESPQAAFKVSQVSGGAPLTVSSTNLSTGYSSLQWMVNGSEISQEREPIFTFDDQGIYQIELIVQNDIGCSDTAKTSVEVVDPQLDIVLEELIILSDTSQADQLLLTVRNQGTLIIDVIDVLVNLGDVVSLKEKIDGPFLPGERASFPLKTTLTTVRNQLTPIEYICASVTGISGQVVEENTSDNRVCITLSSPVLLESPYPNPARDEVVLSVLLEEPGEIQVKLISNAGEMLLSDYIQDAQAGLNALKLDVSQVPSGIYALKISALGQTLVRRIIVNP